MEDMRAAAGLPRLILIGDRFTESKRWNDVLEASEHVPWVHVRDHDASEEAFRAQAVELSEHVRAVAPATMISINGRLDVAEELETGFHTGAEGVPVSEARKRLGPEAIVGFSAHYLTEAKAALSDGADYVFFSPIFASPSKPGYVGVGVEELREFCARMGNDVPVYAVGGLTPERVGPCLEAGAYGAAVLSGILHQDDFGSAAEAFLDALQKTV